MVGRGNRRCGLNVSSHARPRAESCFHCSKEIGLVAEHLNPTETIRKVFSLSDRASRGWHEVTPISLTGCVLAITTGRSLG